MDEIKASQPIWVDDFMVANFTELFNYLGIYSGSKKSGEKKRTVRHCLSNNLRYKGLRISYTPPPPTERPYIEKVHVKGEPLITGHVTHGIGLYR